MLVLLTEKGCRKLNLRDRKGVRLEPFDQGTACELSVSTKAEEHFVILGSL